MPGDNPALGRHGLQHLRRQIARRLEVHQVVAGRRLDQPPLAPLGRALEGAALGAAAQGIEEPPREEAESGGIEVPHQVGPHLQPVDAIQGGGGEARQPPLRQGRDRRDQRSSLQNENLLPNPEGG